MSARLLAHHLRKLIVDLVEGIHPASIERMPDLDVITTMARFAAWRAGLREPTHDEITSALGRATEPEDFLSIVERVVCGGEGSTIMTNDGRFN